MGFRIPSILDIVFFLFTKALPIFFVISLGVRLFLHKSKRYNSDDTEKLNLVAAMVPAGLFVAYSLSLLFNGNIPFALVGIAIIFSIYLLVFLLLEAISYSYALKKPLNYMFMILVFGIVIYIFMLSKPHTSICKSETCRTSPLECINGRTANGTPCVSIDTTGLD